MKHIRYISRIVIIGILQLSFIPLFGQKEIKHARQGNREYRGSKYDEAELLYRRSADINPEYSDAVFNLGDALYKQEKYSDASKNFRSLAENELDISKRSLSLYNLGNSLLKENMVEESIEAYKNSLRIDPSNMQAKYNLAYAQDLLAQQQKQQQQQEQENQNKDNKNNKEDQENNKDQENKQDEESNQDDQQNEDNKNADNQDDEQKEEQQKPQQQQISKEDAERLLQALASDEQEVQEKVKEAKAARNRVRTLKNW